MFYVFNYVKVLKADNTIIIIIINNNTVQMAQRQRTLGILIIVNLVLDLYMAIIVSILLYIYCRFTQLSHSNLNNVFFSKRENALLFFMFSLKSIFKNNLMFYSRCVRVCVYV